jgi:DHA1 family bicyclomycin/chloramphenicol resistance-like MFS transporter
MPFTCSNRFFVMLVMGMAAVNIFCIDIYLSALPLLAEFFGCSPATMQSSVSVFVLGSAVGPLIFGPLSDAYGRRPVVLICQLLYGFSFLGIICVQYLPLFFCVRFLNGLFASVGATLAFSILMESFDSKRSTIYFAYLTTVITLSFMISPLVGGFIVEKQQAWQGVFLCVALMGLVSFGLLYTFLPETNKAPKKQSIKMVFQIYGRILSNRYFITTALIPALLIGGFVMLLTSASFYLIKPDGLTPKTFGMLNSLYSGCNALGSFMAGYLMQKVGRQAVLRLWSVILFISVAGLLIVVSTSFSVWWFSFFTCLYASTIGLVFAIMIAQSIHTFPENAGVAASLVTTVRNTTIAISAMVAGYVAAAFSFSGVVTLLSVMALVIFGLYGSVRQRLLG